MAESIFIVLSIVFIGGIIIVGYLAYILGKRQGELRKEAQWQANLVKIRREIAEKQRTGIKGKVGESFAPFLQDFPFSSSECKFIGDPIDYIVFEGLDERDIKGIHFVEIKTGKSKLSKVQQQIKDLVNSGKNIAFHTLNLQI